MNGSMSVGDRVGMLFAEAQRIVLSAPAWAAGYIVLVSAIAVLVDTQGLTGGGDFLVNITSFVVGYFMTRAFLEQSGIAKDGLSGGFGTYFGIAILSGIAIAFGLVLLILPGLFLIARWAPVYGIALDRGEATTQSLGAAWNMTSDHVGPLIISIIPPALLIGAGLTAMVFGTQLDETVTLPAAIISNLLIFSATVVSTAIGLAAYSLLGAQADTLEQVFD